LSRNCATTIVFGVKLLGGRAMEFGPVAWNVIASVIVAAGGFVFGRSLFLWRRANAKRQRREAGGTQFAILVAGLDGDANGSQTNHIVAGLEKQLLPPGEACLRVLSYSEVLAVGSGERTPAMAAAEARGRDWLEQEGADLLLWGEAGENGLLRLRFLQPEGDGGPTGPYALNAELELPQNFGEDGAVAIAALAATAILQVREGSGETLAPLIEAVLERLRPLAENPPASFGGAVRAELWHAYGAGQLCLAQKHGDPSRFVLAAAYFRKALEEWPRERAPLEWAKAQNNLGTALSALGMRESGTELLQAAANAFGDALQEWTRERAPLAWASVYSNLGAVLASLGERGDGNGAERFHQAAEACRRALKEQTRKRVPLQWASTQINLGNALAAIGEREDRTAYIGQAIQAFRDALKGATRERAPLRWAAAQNSLGTALASLGERKGSARRLYQATEAYSETLKEWTRERAPAEWAGVYNNLGSALTALGDLKNSVPLIEKAAAAFRKALEVWTRESDPLNWAMAQNNLGNALLRLGERQGSKARFEEAVAAFREALKERTRERTPLEWAAAQNNLGDACANLAGEESHIGWLEQAAEAFREAAKELTRERAPGFWAASQMNLGNALGALGERQAETDKLQGCVTMRAGREAYAAALEVSWNPFVSALLQTSLAQLDAAIARLCG
jgi:tetratricopeptide (TPR) repeat protein